MVGKNPDIAAARQVELAAGQCETLSILPSSACRFFTQLSGMELTPSSMAELIQSDPAFTVIILRLCQNKGITVKQPVTWIQQALETLSLREIRDAVLSAKIYGGLGDEPRTAFRRELSRHSMAVACCAEKLAHLTTPPLESATAYLAGLLHDTGKFLLDEVMPKSFDTLLEQAKSRKVCFCEVEQENLGIDHTILGKRFAQKLRLPGDIILGIWLHHSQTGAISQAMPQARIAALVEVADGIVRRAGIGESGSYDDNTSLEGLTEALGLSAEQISEVEEQLPEIVREKSEAAGLTLLRPGWAYCDALRGLASQLAGETTKLSEESARLQYSASHFDFVKELLPKINPNMTPIEFAKDFALCWQRFYQTGPVCVYLVGPSTQPGTGSAGSKVVEAVVVENQTEIKTEVFNVPEESVIVPQPVSEKFAVVDAADYVKWLLEQVEVEFDLTRTKLAGLSGGDRTAGAIVFELRHPIKDNIEQRFEPAARLGGTALDILESIGRQQWYAERFAQLLVRPPGLKPAGAGKTPDSRPKTGADAEALAEMAAGAAHELNNPLSVISGRAQMLAGFETDSSKKKFLEQIQQNASELSAIIDDLMSYANPGQPRPTETAVSQIIADAVDLTSQKTGTGELDIKIDAPDDLPKVLADSAQIAIAVSNIICNGLESYDSGSGPIEVKAEAEEAKGSVIIRVIDSGRGMDEQTLAKATQPFFSARPAGRKRGMGLAHAQRLIQINKGTLEITSQQGKGTTVTVTLPCI